MATVEVCFRLDRRIVVRYKEQSTISGRLTAHRFMTDLNAWCGTYFVSRRRRSAGTPRRGRVD